MLQIRRRWWLRPTAGMSLLVFVSLTCAPICGNALDVDSVSCCERHGCIPAGHRDESMGSPSHAAMAVAPAFHDSIGFDTEKCCREGELTYPTAQVHGSATAGSAFQFVAGFVFLVVDPPLQSQTERQARFSADSPPTPLYALHSTFRI